MDCRRRLFALTAVALLPVALGTTTRAAAGDEHWSRQFRKPASSTKMLPGTGMSRGNTKPRMRRAKWHDGKLWMAGAWEPGVSAADITKQERNVYWHLWTYSPQHGYEPVCYFPNGKSGEARGPDGQIYDFVWLPDGRLVVAGAFTRVANPGGNVYHRVNALAIYDPKEKTADKWKPLGSFQYNGTVSEGGSIEAIAYDPKGNDLYIGGTFAGIRGIQNPKIHRYDFDTGAYEPVEPGLWGPKATVHRLWVDTSTEPSTVYVGGRFHYTAGDGQTPAAGGTSRYTTGFAAYQLDKGWKTFPEAGGKLDENVLQRAADFMYFDSVHVHDFLVDHTEKGTEIWIVGSFSEGKDGTGPLRGIARWDAEKQVWVDPTGKGGIGRECWSIAKADNGKYYFAGAFGGKGKTGGGFDGFKNGDPAAMAISYDPKTGAWEQLGSGLDSLVFPECRLAVNGNDVYYVGDFEAIGAGKNAKEQIESSLIARWNETIDFTATPAEVAESPTPPPTVEAPEQPWASGNEHWSRAFPAPPRRKRPDEPAHTAKTGMDIGTGTPDVRGMVWLDDTLYFAGVWQVVPNSKWFVWSYHAERGWEGLAFEERGGEKTGPCSIPDGVKAHDGKVWAYGALQEFKGIGIYDPKTKQWSKLKGKAPSGDEVIGHGVAQGGGTIHDIAWDGKTGDLYMVGASGIEATGRDQPANTAKVIRVDKDGNYHPMGYGLSPEDPGKPVKVIQCVYLDETKDPTDVYIGGTFGYYGPSPTKRARMAFNIAKWDHAEKDWRHLGWGAAPTKEIDQKYWEKGYPGLPPLPAYFIGFLRTDFPRVRCITMDAEGNLYAGGTLAIFDHRLPVKDRKEAFGLAKLDAKTGQWVDATTIGGVSRDVLEFEWLDEGRTKLLMCGAFEYDNRWNRLNSVAILDVKTGKLEPLGGGLMRESREQVIASMVRHARRGSELWFGGLFDHAGVNGTSRIEAPIQSLGIAMWDPTKSLDPNAGLTVKPVEPVAVRAGSGRASLEASFEGEGTITWFERRADGSYVKKGTGPKYTANFRLGRGETSGWYYVCIVKPDGTEGGKVPVEIPIQK